MKNFGSWINTIITQQISHKYKNVYWTLKSVLLNLVSTEEFLEFFHVSVFVPETFQQQVYHLKASDSQEKDLS